MNDSTSRTEYRACNLCEAICGIEVVHSDGAVVSIAGDKNDPFSRGHVCPKAVALKDLYEDPNRLKMPVRRRYDWPAAGVIEVCNEAAKSVEQIRTLLAGRPDKNENVDAEIDQELGVLTTARILYEERGKYFTLAVPENPYL